MGTTMDAKRLKIGIAGTVAAVAIGMSGAASAEHYSQGHGYHHSHGYHGHRCGNDYHDGYHRAHYAPVVEYHYYQPREEIVYVEPPPVVYQQQYSVPTYRSSGGYGGYPGYGNNRVISSAVLGAAGGFLGSQIGHGDERAAATAAGAVAGWVLGGNLGW